MRLLDSRKRDVMFKLLNREDPGYVPQWIMAFFNDRTTRRLVPEKFQYNGYSEYPPEGCYSFAPMGDENLLKEQQFNVYIDRCAFPVGWGANAAFGHGGPGEFNKKIIEKDDDHFVAEYETGAKREVRSKPHNVRIFDLPIKNADDLDRLILPDPEDPGRYNGIKDDIEWAKAHDEWAVGWINGFFSGVHYFLREYSEFLIDLIDNPIFARKLIKKIGDWTLKAARMLCESGVDCIGFCDDLGSGNSLLISPDMYREFILPWHRDLCSLVHHFGAVVHMHSHGAIFPILKDISEAGVDILNPLDPDEFMPVAAVRSAVGPEMVLCGGLSKNIFYRSRGEMESQIMQAVKNGLASGPYILMDSGGIPEDMNGEDFRWFLETSKQIRGVNCE
jgi:uroporphyrinogen decarboxylase